VTAKERTNELERFDTQGLCGVIKPLMVLTNARDYEIDCFVTARFAANSTKAGYF